MKKRMLADVLWEAANVHLCAVGNTSGDKECYSCAAVSKEFNYLMPMDVRLFLESLGCATHSDSLLHKPWKPTPESQGVRYMWLLLAMHVAESEGLTC